jgi:SAM-dependent methyltransferase
VTPTSNNEHGNQDKIWRHQQANDGQGFPQEEPRHRWVADRVIARTRAGAAVLNIGIGGAWIEQRIARSGRAVTALDPDADAVARIVALGMRGQTGYIESMPFAAESFDAVSASEVLEHLHDEQRATALAEIRRVLKPGGVFVGTVPYAEDLRASDCVCPHCGEVFHRWGHRASFDERELSGELRARFRVDAMSVRAFPDLRAKSPALLAKHLARAVIGRVAKRLIYMNLAFEASRIDSGESIRASR